MKSVYILLNSIEKVRGFVNDISSVEGDVIIGTDQRFIDAKSIIGIFSLDLSKPLELKIKIWREEYLAFIERYMAV